MLAFLYRAFRILSNPHVLHINLTLIFVNVGLLLCVFLVAKILMRDRSLRLKESLYIVLSSLLCGIAYTVYLIALERGYPFGIALSTYFFYRVPLLLLLFVYLYKLKSYSVKKAVILLIYADLITTVTGLFVFYIRDFFSFLFPTRWLRRLLFDLPANLILTALFAFLLVKLFGRARKTLNANDRLLTVFFLGSFISWLTYQIIAIVMSLDETAHYTWWPTLLLLGYTGATIVSFFFYTRSMNTKLLLQRKEIEQENLQFYMDEIEQQQTAMRRFKHDYQNILSSLYSFIKEEDIAGLKQYYASKVEAASTVITQNDFALEALGKIKVREIKGILAAKLLMAQNMGIATTFEADGEIDHIAMDSVTLVRMLGIILDNAIEALSALGTGQLRVACLKMGGGVIFIVRNDCSPDMPKLHQLRQDGFSTKGKSRGQGLSILSELANACPNVTLDTSIAEGKFVQKLIIGGA